MSNKEFSGLPCVINETMKRNHDVGVEAYKLAGEIGERFNLSIDDPLTKKLMDLPKKIAESVELLQY